MTSHACRVQRVTVATIAVLSIPLYLLAYPERTSEGTYRPAEPLVGSTRWRRSWQRGASTSSRPGRLDGNTGAIGRHVLVHCTAVTRWPDSVVRPKHPRNFWKSLS